MTWYRLHLRRLWDGVWRGGGEEVRSNFMSLTNGIRSVSLVFGGVSDNPHPTYTSHPPLSAYNCGQCWRVLNGSRLVIRVRKKKKKKKQLALESDYKERSLYSRYYRTAGVPGKSTD